MVFNEIVNELDRLSTVEKGILFKKLQLLLGISPEANNHLLKDMREVRFNKGFECPHCSSKHIVRFGKYNSHQRFRCKCCNKTFTDTTNTFLHRSRKNNEWIRFVECMFNGFTLRKSAEIVGVSWVTLFYWRHKILNALSQLDFEKFEGIVEIDETYFLYSEKGKKDIKGRKPRKRGGKSKFRGISKEQVCVVVARDRKKSTVAQVACLGRVQKGTVHDLLDSKISKENVLVTDAWRGYMTYAKENGLEHYRINSKSQKHVKNMIYHIQNVNSYHGRFKGWLYKFKGVSSKYLNNYLALFNLLDSLGNENTQHNIENFILKTFTLDTKETFNSIRLAKFAAKC